MDRNHWNLNIRDLEIKQNALFKQYMASNKRILIIGITVELCIGTNFEWVQVYLRKKTLTQNLTRNYYLQQNNYLQLVET